MMTWAHSQGGPTCQRETAESDKFCPTGPNREGGGGPQPGWKKNKGGCRAEIKKRISELKIGFLNLPRLGNLHNKI
jgi:hypothetical protein